MPVQVRGYLLIQTQMGKAKPVAEAIRKLPGVESVDTVSGSWDAIAMVKGDSIEQIGQLVTGKIRNIEGVQRTLTSFVLSPPAK